MAKWGEGDPRWIVEDRPDATNVNNWHWREKDASGWSKTKIKELLQDLQIVDENIGHCWLSSVEEVEGEASASSRKKKLIFFYEWDIKVKWQGQLTGSSEEVKGAIEIPNLSEEYDLEDLEVKVSTETTDPAAEILREFMRNRGAEVIKDQLKIYIQDLKTEYAQGLILPGKDVATSSKKQVPVNKKSQVAQADTMLKDACKKNLHIGCKISTSQLSFKKNFKCTAEEFYNVMTQTEMVQAFTSGPVKLDARKGGTFELFGGNVSGEFVELEPQKKLVQKWRLKGWPSGHYSTVTIDISQKEDGTDVMVKQVAVPTDELDNTVDGWERYYWESIKRTFGFGVTLL